MFALHSIILYNIVLKLPIFICNIEKNIFERKRVEIIRKAGTRIVFIG